MAAFLAEVGLAEVAGVEIALDGILYADIRAAAGATFAGDSQGGRVVYVDGSASLGAAAHDHLSQVITQPATATMVYDGQAEGGLFADLGPHQEWKWESLGGFGTAYYAEGSGAFGFEGAAVGVDGYLGVGSLSWASAATGHRLVWGRPMAELAFVAVLHSSKVENRGPAEFLRWSGGAVGAWARSAPASAPWGFSGRAAAGLWAHLEGTGDFRVTGLGDVVALRQACGFADLKFSTLAAVTPVARRYFRAQSQWRFLAHAQMRANVYLRAEGAVRFDGLGRAVRLLNARPTARMAFEATAVTGGAFYTNLPRAREGFEVPPAVGPWVIAPDAELKEV